MRIYIGFQNKAGQMFWDFDYNLDQDFVQVLFLGGIMFRSQELDWFQIWAGMIFQKLAWGLDQDSDQTWNG